MRHLLPNWQIGFCQLGREGIAMQHFTDSLKELRAQVDSLTRQIAMVKPGCGDNEPPLFVTIGAPAVTDEQLERLFAQEAG